MIKIEARDGLGIWRVYGVAKTLADADRIERDARKTWLNVRRVEG